MSFDRLGREISWFGGCRGRGGKRMREGEGRKGGYEFICGYFRGLLITYILYLFILFSTLSLELVLINEILCLKLIFLDAV